MSNSQELEFKIGKLYYRPSVEVAAKTAKREPIRVPILHSHVGDISEKEHSHIDWRFVDEKLEQLIGSPKEGIIGVRGEVITHDFICVRQQIFPTQYDASQVKALKTIEKKCSARTLDLSTMACPHQGCAIAHNCQTVIDGQLSYICSCHGLAWNATTGEAVKRSHSLKAASNA